MKTIEILNTKELLQVRGGGDDIPTTGQPIKDGANQ